MRTCFRLHLLDLLDLRSSPTVLPSLLSTPVETMAPPSKAHCEDSNLIACSGIEPLTPSSPSSRCQYAFGGGGGSRTHVQKSFALKGLQQYFILYLI
jgi:hypothetical protein